jgi:hypothetical protein
MAIIPRVTDRPILHTVKRIQANVENLNESGDVSKMNARYWRMKEGAVKKTRCLQDRYCLPQSAVRQVLVLANKNVVRLSGKRVVKILDYQADWAA